MLRERVSDLDREVVVVRVIDLVSDSRMVLDSLISKESVAVAEIDVVVDNVVDRLCDIDWE